MIAFYFFFISLNTQTATRKKTLIRQVSWWFFNLTTDSPLIDITKFSNSEKIQSESIFLWYLKWHLKIKERNNKCHLNKL